MSLVCLKCGYKQGDEETVAEFRKRFPGVEDHDIPYYCGACQDESDDEEYEDMVNEMSGTVKGKSVVSLTCKNVADLLFKDKDRLPKLEFYLTKDDFDDYSGGCEIAVIDFADSHLVIGNYAGGGSPFCYDLTDDSDDSGLYEMMLAWLKEIDCDEVDGECILHVDEFSSDGETLPEVIIVIEDGMLSGVYSNLQNLGVELIDKDVTDEKALKDVDDALEDVEKWKAEGKLFSMW